MKDDPTPIRACLCYPHTFVEVKSLADANAWTTVADITANLGCGNGCGLCRPYLERVLETGKTAFAISLDFPETDPET